MTTTIAPFQDAAGWERALYAFLAEKERRSGSRRTVEGYSRMLQHFFGALGKPPDQVTSQEVFAWAYGKGLSGREPSPVTIGARMACLSSFYRFLIRMGIVASNPCDQMERPQDLPEPAPRTQRRGDPEAPGGHPRHAGRPAGPRHHPHPDPDRPAPLRGPQPEGRRHLAGRRALLHLPGQGRQAGQAGASQARLRGHRDGSGGLRQGPGDHGPRRVAVAVEHSTQNGRGLTSGTFYATSGGTCREPACRPPGSTSCATRRPSCGGTPASQSRM